MHSPDGIISYYWYDLILSLQKKDYLMIAHHLFTLFSLNQCDTHPDYNRIYYSLFMLKTGDLFLHHLKITDALDLYSKYPLSIRLYQLATLSITFVLWIVYRLILPFYVYPFETYTFKILSVTFHLLNTIWLIKLYNSIQKKYIEYVRNHEWWIRAEKYQKASEELQKYIQEVKSGEVTTSGVKDVSNIDDTINYNIWSRQNIRDLGKSYAKKE
jgi:hypothetical protein